MHSIDSAGNRNGRFVAGDPVNGIVPTRLTPEWLNAVQTEINSVIVAAGLTPSKYDDQQLVQALAVIMGMGNDNCVSGGYAFGSVACDADSTNTTTDSSTDNSGTTDSTTTTNNGSDDITQSQSNDLFNPDNL